MNPPGEGDLEPEAAEPEAAGRSLADDAIALIDDAKIWLEAEAGFQKTRAAFAASQIKTMLLGAVIAILVGFVGLMALAAGLIIALTPHLTAWGATAVVAGALFLVVAILVLAALRSWKRLVGAFRAGEE